MAKLSELRSSRIRNAERNARRKHGAICGPSRVQGKGGRRLEYEKTYREYGEDVNALGTELLAQRLRRQADYRHGHKQLRVGGDLYGGHLRRWGHCPGRQRDSRRGTCEHCAGVSEAALVVYGRQERGKGGDSADPTVARCSFAKLVGTDPLPASGGLPRGIAPILTQRSTPT